MATAVASAAVIVAKPAVLAMPNTAMTAASELDPGNGDGCRDRFDGATSVVMTAVTVASWAVMTTVTAVASATTMMVAVSAVMVASLALTTASTALVAATTVTASLSVVMRASTAMVAVTTVMVIRRQL